MIEDYEKVLGLWYDYCYCNGDIGPRPTEEDFKLGGHLVDCVYRQRVEQLENKGEEL